MVKGKNVEENFLIYAWIYICVHVCICMCTCISEKLCYTSVSLLSPVQKGIVRCGRVLPAPLLVFSQHWRWWRCRAATTALCTLVGSNICSDSRQKACNIFCMVQPGGSSSPCCDLTIQPHVLPPSSPSWGYPWALCEASLAVTTQGKSHFRIKFLHNHLHPGARKSHCFSTSLLSISPY